MKRQIKTFLILMVLVALALLWPSRADHQLLQTVLDESGCQTPGSSERLFDLFTLEVQAQGEEGAQSVCDDYEAVCEDVAYRTMVSCDFWGLGDCFCKAQRAYNKCMNDYGCPGISAEAMQRQGCSCINRSCMP